MIANLHDKIKKHMNIGFIIVNKHCSKRQNTELRLICPAEYGCVIIINTEW